ncbi:acyl-CoA N-acyltransferase [Dichomitus squalens]|uniref:Acyl-CoA N-acyltransferase n=1 Tax=Dichomitus squalens TaxID=114155 RepID=A0A4Q9PVF8_9APHY|nr:acyl-CoA N-acyltransferase [Dichomitus squalens]
MAPRRSTRSPRPSRSAWNGSRHSAEHYYPCLVAELVEADAGSTRTVGWCNLWHYKERPAYDATAELSLYVHESLRGKGIGAKLLERTLEETRKHGERFHVVTASVTTENERTMKFWAEHGFELRGTVKEVGHKFGRWLDVSYFQLTL